MTTRRKKKAITKAKKRAKTTKRAVKKSARTVPIERVEAWRGAAQRALYDVLRALKPEPISPSVHALHTDIMLGRLGADFDNAIRNVAEIAAEMRAWEGFARAIVGSLALAKFTKDAGTMTIAGLARAVEETNEVAKKVNAAINVVTNDAASFDDTKEAIRVLRAMLQIAGPLVGSVDEDIDTTAVRAASGSTGDPRDLPIDSPQATPELGGAPPEGEPARDEGDTSTCFNCHKATDDESRCFGCNAYVCNDCDKSAASGGLMGHHKREAHLVG